MSDCILWQGRIGNHGYGVVGGRLAHRIAYEEVHGQIPRGHQIHHTCGTRPCVNPAHLVALTPMQHNAAHGMGANMAAYIEAQRAKTHCPQGHAYDAANTIVKRGKRHCRTCENARARAYHQKHRERILPVMRERERARRLRSVA